MNTSIKDFVFITDLHLMTQCKVRTGDVVEDLAAKLQFVIDYCNEHEAALLIGGDIFDKPCVPDYLKAKFIAIFAKAKYGIYTTIGNHDMLYNNPDYTFKTSYNLFCEAGVFTDLDSVDFIEFDSAILSSKLPVTDKPKPQIVIYHAFLNMEDGRNTVKYQDIQVKSTPTYLALGHDHVSYEPIQYTPNVKIFRPGSILRGIRSSDQERQPKLLHFKVIDGVLKNKAVEIPSRDWKEIFKTKEAKAASASEITDKYEEIISKIRSAQVTNLSFEQALNQVADKETVEFTMRLLESSRQEKSLNKSRL